MRNHPVLQEYLDDFENLRRSLDTGNTEADFIDQKYKENQIDKFVYVFSEIGNNYAGLLRAKEEKIESTKILEFCCKVRGFKINTFRTRCTPFDVNLL